LASPEDREPNSDTQLLGRWWSTTLSSAELSDIVPVDDVVSATLAGDLHLRGWGDAKAKGKNVDLKLALNPAKPKVRFDLPECSSSAASQRQKLLLLMLTEGAQENDCRLLGGGSGEPKVIQLQSEVDQLLRQLKKRDHMLDDLKSQLDTANEHLKGYIKDAAPARPVPTGPKFPANHGKASVTKKRRLVQTVEYED